VHIREKQKSRRYVLDMQARLHFAAKTFTANIGDIKTAEMDRMAGLDEEKHEPDKKQLPQGHPHAVPVREGKSCLPPVSPS